MIRIHSLGHIVLYVTDLKRSAHFYGTILGWGAVANKPGIALFSSGRTHHELLLIEIGGMPEHKQWVRPWLYHIGLCIGNSDDDLREALKTLQENNIALNGATDHTVTHSLYIADPDGNEVELYVDVNDAWKTDPTLITHPAKPLRLV